MPGQAMAIRGAENYRSLRAKGIPIRKTLGVIIATHCMEHDFSNAESGGAGLPTGGSS